MKISHLVLCGGLTFALLLSGCADSNTKTTSKKTVPRTTVVTTIIPGEVGTDQNVDGATVTLNGVYRSSITDVHNGQNCNAIFFSFTVSNQTDAPISANFLQTCQIQLDGKPWYGQLMAGPQMMAYLLQINYWLKEYHISIEF